LHISTNHAWTDPFDTGPARAGWADATGREAFADAPEFRPTVTVVEIYQHDRSRVKDFG
jgi:hypothetical protein